MAIAATYSLPAGELPTADAEPTVEIPATPPPPEAPLPAVIDPQAELPAAPVL